MVVFCVQKRLLVFVAGDKLEMSQYVWGQTVRQVLDNSSTRLGLKKPAKYLFTLDGRLVCTTYCYNDRVNSKERARTFRSLAGLQGGIDRCFTSP